LRGCLGACPDLWARLRLRFARDQVPDADDPAASQPAEALPQAHLGRLWRTALRAVQEEQPA
jgi:hypothetical protein